MTDEELRKLSLALKPPQENFLKTPQGGITLAVLGFLAVFTFNEIRSDPAQLGQVVSELDESVRKLNTTVSNLELSDQGRSQQLEQLRSEVDEMDDRLRALSRSVQEAQVTQDSTTRRIETLESRNRQ